MLRECAAKNCHIACVANDGHSCPPPSTVISTTLRPSGQSAVDVVDRAVGGDRRRRRIWSTLRQKAFRSGTDGPPSGVATPEPGPPS